MKYWYEISGKLQNPKLTLMSNIYSKVEPEGSLNAFVLAVSVSFCKFLFVEQEEGEGTVEISRLIYSMSIVLQYIKIMLLISIYGFVMYIKIL